MALRKENGPSDVAEPLRTKTLELGFREEVRVQERRFIGAGFQEDRRRQGEMVERFQERRRIMERSFPPERRRYVEQEPQEERALQLEYQREIGWVNLPRLEITMIEGEGVVSAQMKNLVEGNQVQEEEKEDERVMIFSETLLKKRVQPTREGLITKVLITWLGKEKGEATWEITKVLITWLGKDEGEATWESIEDIMLHFPEIDLEDKVNVKGEVMLRLINQ